MESGLYFYVFCLYISLREYHMLKIANLDICKNWLLEWKFLKVKVLLINKKNIAIHENLTFFFFSFLTTKSVKTIDIRFLVFVIAKHI